MLELLRAFLDFVAAYPYLAYGLGFLAALVEALPILGAAVPGSTVIVALGALVATGAIHLWPLTAWAVVGAVIGDGLSYEIGRRYGRAILARPPLNRYPRLAAESEAFFERHGGKSVVLGRFLPAARAFVPLFAGILRMPPARFYVANIASAVAWAPAHILPGVALGASLALAGAVAGRLLLFVALLVVVLWIAVWIVRYVLRRGLPALEWLAERALRWAATDGGWLKRYLRSLLEPGEIELRGLLVATVLLVAALWLFFGLLEDIVTGDPLVRADAAIYGLLQSLRTPWGDSVTVAATELGDSVVVVAVTVAVLLWLLWRRAWRTAVYWVAAVALGSLFNTGLKFALFRPRPVPDLYGGLGVFSFPSGHATVNVVMWGFLAFLVSRELKPLASAVVATVAAGFVVLIAFSRLYLGAHWFSDVAAGIAFGSAWIALLGIVYLHHRPEPVRPLGLLAVACVALIGAGAVHIDRSHAEDMARYAPRQTERTMSAAEWRESGWATLPARRVDLKGELEEPFTIEWAGDVQAVAARLAAAGWREPPAWDVARALLPLLPSPDPRALPVLPRLDDGRLPELTRILPQADGARLVLRLWASGLMLRDDGGALRPVLIGAVVEERPERLLTLVTLSRTQDSLNPPRDTLAAAIGGGRLVDRPDVMPDARWDGRVLLLEEPGGP
jgi:membrane protein DedA with SNARE-associated domain/membrane-associated phospholipid phosphatase